MLILIRVLGTEPTKYRKTASNFLLQNIKKKEYIDYIIVLFNNYYKIIYKRYKILQI